MLQSALNRGFFFRPRPLFQKRLQLSVLFLQESVLSPKFDKDCHFGPQDLRNNRL